VSFYRSAITYVELEYGTSMSADPECERTNLASLVEGIPVAPFDTPADITYGPIRMATKNSRKSSRQADCHLCGGTRGDSRDQQRQGLHQAEAI